MTHYTRFRTSRLWRILAQLGRRLGEVQKSTDLLERLVTMYSANLISLRSVDKPSSSEENCLAEPSETSNADSTSLVWYPGWPRKRLTKFSVSRIGTLSNRRTRGSVKRLSIGLGMSKMSLGWAGFKIVALARKKRGWGEGRPRSPSNFPLRLRFSMKGFRESPLHSWRGMPIDRN